MVKRKRCKLCNHEDRDDIEAALETMARRPDAIDLEYDWPSGTTAKHQRNHMGEYIDASNPRCKLCTHELRSLVEQQLQEGNITPSAVANMADCSEEQVKRHMRKHLQPLVQKAAANIIALREVDLFTMISRKYFHA
mgnify:CR=1 FL=1